MLNALPGDLMSNVYSEDPVDDVSTIEEDFKNNVEVNAPLGRLNFSIHSDNKDYSIVSIIAPNNQKINKLYKSNEKGEYKPFESNMLTYLGESSELDEWLDTLV